MRSARTRFVLLALAPLLFAASAADGQVLRGRVLDAVSGQPLADAGILIHANAELYRVLVTDSAGSFEVRLPRAGEYTITASRDGFWTVGPASFDAPAGRVLDVVLRLSAGPIAINAIEVYARRLPSSALDAAHERSIQNRRLGIGLHLSREEIDDSFAYNTTDLVRSMSLQLRSTQLDATGTESALFAQRMGGRCTLAIFLDGVYIHPAAGGIDDLITPDHIDSVEVYFGSQVRDGFQDPSGCGMVLVWSRRDAPRYRFTWLGSAFIAAVAGLVYLVR